MLSPADLADAAQSLRRPLIGYFFRALASSDDAEDLFQETLTRALENLSTFSGRSSLKTWLFAIGTNLLRDRLRAGLRWKSDAQDEARRLAESDPAWEARIRGGFEASAAGVFEVREHIDFCFTCTGKTLEIEKQLALLLADVCGFKDREIARIMNCSVPAVKRRLHDARKRMMRIFDDRCALVSKRGACWQCTELVGYFNGAQAEAMEKLRYRELQRGRGPAALYRLRKVIVQSVDPVDSPRAGLHLRFLDVTRAAIGLDSPATR